MTRLPPLPPEEKKEIGGATLSLIALGLSELRKDVDRLLQAGWPEPVRRRAFELSTTLWQACSRQGLLEIAEASRAMSGLTALSRDKALPLRPALREKFDELLGIAERRVAKLTRRRQA